MTKHDRVQNVNQLIKVIGDGGRNFFKHKDRYASMEIDCRGKIWWVDDYTEKRIYTHYEFGRWRGFSHGGTLRDLVRALRNYVTKGEPVPTFHFGPWPEHFCNGDLWGYGDYMDRVRDSACNLGITNQQSKVKE